MFVLSIRQRPDFVKRIPASVFCRAGYGLTASPCVTSHQAYFSPQNAKKSAPQPIVAAQFADFCAAGCYTERRKGGVHHDH